MKRIKIVLIFGLLIMCTVLLVGCGSDNKAKTGYKLWQDIMIKEYGKDGVDFDGASFVKIENGSSDVYYYRCQFTVWVDGTDAKDTAYIRWFLGTSQVFESSQDVYDLAYDSVEKNEVEGLLGTLK